MYSTGKFAKMIGVHVRTIQRWDRVGILNPDNHTPKGRRLYSHEQYLKYLNKPMFETKKSIIYARVSSYNQKEDLKSQISSIEQYCTMNQIHIDDVYQDVGSGLNYKRRNFLKMVNEITSGEIERLVIAHKDRVVRFGFELIEELCKTNFVDLVIINNEKQSPQEEVVVDLMTIIHAFSSRLYGLRTYKNKIKTLALEENEDLQKS